MDKNSQAQPKLIALVSNSTWTLYNFRIDLIRFLIMNQYRVLVVAPPDEFARLLEAEGCQFCAVHFNNRAEDPLQDLKLYLQLKRIYRKNRPDLVFHYVIKPNIYGSLAAASCSIKSIAVITGLGYPFARKNWLYRLVSLLYKKSLRHVEEVWFLNNEDASIFIKERIVDIVKIKMLPGEGINTDFFAAGSRSHADPPEPFRFLVSTRLLKSKGVGIYADAARLLRKKNYDAVFELIGFLDKKHPDSIDEEDLKKWEQEGLIIYRGFVADVRPHLQNADCFVFPSFYNEGIPRSLMEAASMQLPIITSLNRGCKEVVQNEVNGYLFSPKDPFDLADKMERMIQISAAERKAMGTKGRALAIEKFNIKNVLKEYERTLKRL